jgi:hypothetical protein
MEIIVTDHPEGPRGQVPERAQQSEDEADAWLYETLFHEAYRSDVDLEVRQLPDPWNPLSWVGGAVEDASRN